EQTAAIVNTIASLGHTLSVPITAEGVESEQIRAELKKFGCSEAQGWLFGRAVSADTVRAFLEMKQTGGTPDSPDAPPSEPPARPEDAARFTPRLNRRH
ncbi:MAG TPA: EAL domain-containing protein, partial [Sphingomicrobium sp.]